MNIAHAILLQIAFFVFAPSAFAGPQKVQNCECWAWHPPELEKCFADLDTAPRACVERAKEEELIKFKQNMQSCQPLAHVPDEDGDYDFLCEK